LCYDYSQQVFGAVAGDCFVFTNIDTK